jgi:hypothetical protein
MALFRGAYPPHLVWDVGVICYGLKPHNRLVPEARTMGTVQGVGY